MIQENILSKDPVLEDWRQTQDWAKQHSERTAVFLVPSYTDGFQVFSERAIVADWKDGTVGYLSPEYLHEWWNRMEELGIDKTHYSLDDQIKAYSSLSQGKVQNLSAKYKADYFVTDKTDKSYDLEKVNSNRNFIVYRIRPNPAQAEFEGLSR